jgi:DNA (cytosine-5)-methyltransferase 1
MKKRTVKYHLKAVDFFCSIGGMTTGFRQAGVEVIAGIDCDATCKETYEINNKGSEFILADIKKLTFEEFDKLVDLQKDDDTLIFIGCSPCQYWTKINTTKTKSAESKNLLKDFQRFIEHYNPGFVVIENVPGILTKINETPLTEFLQYLDSKKYSYDKGIINASHYGVPQTRRRFMLIASRVTDKIILPQPDTSNIPTVRDFIAVENGFPKVPAGYNDETDFLHTVAGLSDKNIERLKKTPKNGGTRLAYVNNKKFAIPSHHKNKSSFRDVYGRISWDKPAPTLTTKFLSISNGRFAHPEQNRGLSLREGATLQTFHKTYRFFGNSIGTIARHIGNAVPPTLSQKIAKSILESYDATI